MEIYFNCGNSRYKVNVSETLGAHIYKMHVIARRAQYADNDIDKEYYIEQLFQELASPLFEKDDNIQQFLAKMANVVAASPKTKNIPLVAVFKNISCADPNKLLILLVKSVCNDINALGGSLRKIVKVRTALYLNAIISKYGSSDFEKFIQIKSDKIVEYMAKLKKLNYAPNLINYLQLVVDAISLRLKQASEEEKKVVAQGLTERKTERARCCAPKLFKKVQDFEHGTWVKFQFSYQHKTYQINLSEPLIIALLRLRVIAKRISLHNKVESKRQESVDEILFDQLRQRFFSNSQMVKLYNRLFAQLDKKGHTRYKCYDVFSMIEPTDELLFIKLLLAKIQRYNKRVLDNLQPYHERWEIICHKLSLFIGELTTYLQDNVGQLRQEKLNRACLKLSIALKPFTKVKGNRSLLSLIKRQAVMFADASNDLLSNDSFFQRRLSSPNFMQPKRQEGYRGMKNRRLSYPFGIAPSYTLRS